MGRWAFIPVIVFTALVFGSEPAAAESYKVYGHSTPKAGKVELAYWTTNILSSSE